MTDDLLKDQARKRTEYLTAILNSDSPQKLIVAGPGTGKTYTFKELFSKHSGSGDMLALTFIRKLVHDMTEDLGELAEVKTLHAYCKKLLHERKGAVKLSPHLNTIIEEDGGILGYDTSSVTKDFHELNEDSDAIEFYLTRGDYYKAVSFDDSVYRVLQIARGDESFIPSYKQIVIDEFQDFNPMEAAFISELEKRGDILIAGDDDQAVYGSFRHASADHLREKAHSGEYEAFELPFCSRCPRVVVDAVNAFLHNAISTGAFPGRIDRKYVPFLEDKEYENKKYSQIIAMEASTINTMVNAVLGAIERIPDQDITEARKQGYPCVLIVGSRLFLNAVHKKLRDQYTDVRRDSKGNQGPSITDAYMELLENEDSNLGWRIVGRCCLTKNELDTAIMGSVDNTPFKDLLPQNLVDLHIECLAPIRENDKTRSLEKLNKLQEDLRKELVDHFWSDPPPETEIDESEPSILLTSYEGCKGLSAGHVFALGLNDGVMPKINGDNIDDIEVSKFIVAMTRARKLMYLISNRYNFGPRAGTNKRSTFVQMIPEDCLKDAGYITASKLASFLDQIHKE